MRNLLFELGDTIRRRREVLGLVQSRLAALSGVSVRTIQLLERGKGNPSLDTLIKLADPIGLRLELSVKDLSKNSNV